MNPDAMALLFGGVGRFGLWGKRARCRRKRSQRGRSESKRFFGVGALFEQSTESLLEELPVSGEIKAAVLQHEGPEGSVLSVVLGREGAQLDPGPFDVALVNRAWLEALGWAEEACQLTS